MTDHDLLADLRLIFQEEMGVDPMTPIDLETMFFGDLGLASIDAVVLGEAIQARFGRVLPYDRLMAEIGARSQRDLAVSELVEFLRLHL